ncbi:MAG: DNA cytosine methyltransferase [Bacteroidota bacterium]|jgi:DNA (cytosine-5)-methyltransferase 1
MKAIELFAGAGGLSLGLKQAGIDVVLANEIVKDFATTYSINNPQTKVINDDIHNIDWENEISTIGNVDLVSGGPPCQGFSTVGSKNAKDPRNSLFYEYLRCVSVVRPSFVIFENVAGFKRMYNGNAYAALLNELDSLGYNTTSSILEASNYGLPQRRQRTIVIGWKKSLRQVSLPSPTHSKNAELFGLSSKISIWEAISDLPKLKANDSSDRYATEPQNDYQASIRNGCLTLTEHNSTNYGQKMIEILSLVPEGGSVEDLPSHLRPKSYFKNTYARLIPNECSPTITRNFGTPSSSRCIHPFQNRALSTREGARLQGFPDDYVFFGGKCSKNLQIGNAVPPLFGKIIALEIFKTL